jgi:FtsP/CotA-like multicopper oxidase with cupredoxin domain
MKFIGELVDVRSNVSSRCGLRAKVKVLQIVFRKHCHILEHEDNMMMRPYEVVLAEKQKL